MVISCVRKPFHKMCFFIDHQHLDAGHTHSDAGHKHTIFNDLVYGRIRGNDAMLTLEIQLVQDLAKKPDQLIWQLYGS